MRYAADVRPVLFVLLAFGVSLVPFFVTLSLWALVPLLAVIWYVRSYAPYAQHNHAHLPVFHSPVLDYAYNLVLTQLTGYPTSLWELHHNRGHHRHYLQPDRDVASVVSRKTGRTMSRWYYAVQGNLLIHRDSVRIGRAEAREGKKSLLGKLAFEVVAQIAIVGAFLWWNPLVAFFCLVLPALFSAFFIWWESYPHHLGVPTVSTYDGSVTVTDPFHNWQAFNIGHHTAHHEKPTLHWSLLPQRTAAISSRVPKMCVHEKYRHSARRQLSETMAKAGAGAASGATAGASAFSRRFDYGVRQLGSTTE